RLRGFPGWKFCDILVKDRARQALALGTSPKSVVRELSDRMFTRVPGQSKVVPDGPCKEVKLLGNDADITKLPIPIHSEGDAGRYLGSGITITRDPDTGIRNEAIIRAMVKGPRKMGFWMAARHNWAHLMKYQERKQPAPMAFAIGLHPGYEILANYSGRHEGYDELEMGAGVGAARARTVARGQNDARGTRRAGAGPGGAVRGVPRAQQGRGRAGARLRGRRDPAATRSDLPSHPGDRFPRPPAAGLSADGSEPLSTPARDPRPHGRARRLHPAVGDDVHRLHPDDAALGRPGPCRAAGRALQPLPPPEDRHRGGRGRRYLRST